MEKEKIVYKFFSKLKHPTIVVQPQKVNRDGDDLQERIHAKFENKYFQTTDMRIVKFIRNHPEFGHSYLEIDEDTNVPKDVGQQTSKVGIAKMDTADEKFLAAEAEKEKASQDAMADLKEQVGNLASLVTELVKANKVKKDTSKAKSNEKTSKTKKDDEKKDVEEVK